MFVVLVNAAAASVASAALDPLATVWNSAASTPPTDRRFNPDQQISILAAAEAAAPNPAAAAAIAFATRQLGLPYVWGGNGPAKGDAGFDCSGLTMAAYASAGIDIPRTATEQYRHGPGVPLSPLRPGDLIFYGNSSFAHHVGIFVGAGVILDAPKTGTVVRLDPLAADDLFAATRPTADR
ncbi:C40 family peptidase [Catenulispora pinisilvae]|uniref:C40 family peptidase n=1 Tax=Catenulispora pinisilvae TaxID=2705253 RepID=UPI0018921247|nr:C40 family peptidase [Catenulispora pinisilvae]